MITLSISEAARITCVTRQAIHMAIRNGQLKATKNKTWIIKAKDLKEYQEKKYSRSKTKIDGELLYDDSKGNYSVTQASVLMNSTVSHIYYAIYKGYLKASRKKYAWVIHIDDLKQYAAKFKNKLIMVS